MTSHTHSRQKQPTVQFEIGPYKNFVYLVLDWDSKKAGIVDPQSDLTLPLAFLDQNQFELTSILLTHTHHDHTAGVPGLHQLFPNIPVYVHSQDAQRLKAKKIKRELIHLIQDGETLQLGSSTLTVFHTPGHSAGECCYLLNTQPPYLFTGDTLFIRDCGRTDLETGSNQEMLDSLNKIRTLPPSSVILPGHHYQPEFSSTLERELLDSPPFQCKTVEELANLP